jgi:MYXO-CTERM domain-containing protein
MGMSGAFCSAEVIYTANGFEATGTPAFSVDNLDGQNGWSNAGQAGGVVVEKTVVHGGGQAIQLQNSATASGNVRGIARYSLTNAKDHWVDVWVLPPSSDQIGGNPSINLRDGLGIEASVAFIGAGRIAGTTVKYNAGQWNRVTIFVDRTNNNWDAYLNGTEILSNQAFAYSNHTVPIDISRYDIDWTAKAGTTGTGFFADDFQITDSNPLPEPAALGVMGIGGLSLLRRRRK